MRPWLNLRGAPRRVHDGLRALMACLLLLGAVSSGSAAFICALGQACPVTQAEEKDDCCSRTKSCSTESCAQCCTAVPDHSDDALTATAHSFELIGILPDAPAAMPVSLVEPPASTLAPLEISLPNAPPPRRSSRAPPSPAI